MKVHFMGICGCGASAVAIIAKKMGYDVTGCDVKRDGMFYEALIKNNIKVYDKHEKEHIYGKDILAVTAPLLNKKEKYEEILEAEKRKIPVMTWQNFMGKYLQKGKRVVAISGTHGKTTTSVLAGVVLKAGDLQIIVEAGTVYKKWEGGCYVDKEAANFICEADEYNENFLHYNPDILVINNIEMEHHECFENFESVIEAFKKFVGNLKGTKLLIVNEESYGIRRLLKENLIDIENRRIKLIGYYKQERLDYKFYKEYKICNIEVNELGSRFTIIQNDKQENYKIKLPGEYNVENATSAICIAKEYGITYNQIINAFQEFTGVKRRFELIGVAKDIKVYDDFGHHPTALKDVLKMAKRVYKNSRIIAIFEPYLWSRFNMLFEEFIEVLCAYDKAWIMTLNIGREDKKNIDVKKLERMKEKALKRHIKYLEYSDIINELLNYIKPSDIIITFTASEKYSMDILLSINKYYGR